ncbi:protein of unknown function [Paenibacillus alvei]|uniref:Uncharacterized protein n=1 Tax=Paenibacillus alvei TaxID=44250 RepID=A0A383RK45_PAEAL|nr:protein of unknown function [Paenibacillus alvei]
MARIVEPISIGLHLFNISNNKYNYILAIFLLTRYLLLISITNMNFISL